jgi:hypothetical protein
LDFGDKHMKETEKRATKQNHFKTIIFIILGLLILTTITMGIFSFLNKPKGVIFPQNYDISELAQEKRYTPSSDDVSKAEEILKKFLMKENPSIYSKFSRYKLQYFGLINKDNEKVIFINAGIGFEKGEWKRDYLSVDDGGDNYFNIKVNLNQSKCFDFYVNGEA